MSQELLSVKTYLKLGDTTVKVKQVKHALYLSRQQVGGSSCGAIIKRFKDLLMLVESIYDLRI